MNVWSSNYYDIGSPVNSRFSYLVLIQNLVLTVRYLKFSTMLINHFPYMTPISKYLDFFWAINRHLKVLLFF